MKRLMWRRLVAGTALVALGGMAALVWSAGGDYPPVDDRPVDLAGSLGPAPVRGTTVPGRTVVVMLFDGFAPAMLEFAATPTLDRMRHEGTWSHGLHPAFPTVSTINGFTITTGCWPERHGIVHNRFFDRERGFYDHGRDADWIEDCEPLHQVAERQGVRTASFGWYGDRSGERGVLTTEADPVSIFLDYPDDTTRVRDIVRLLERPDEERPRLILTYFRGPDQQGHFTGLDSPETRAAVERADYAVSEVLRTIDERQLRDRVAVVVTTDHGMLPVTHLVNLERILRRHDVEGRMLASGSVAFVYLDDPESAGEVQRRLSGYDQFDVFLKNELPDWSHIGDGPRVGEIVISAHPPYFIEDRGVWPRWSRWLAWVGPEFLRSGSRLRATHGYPPDTPGVQGLFYAWGSGIPRAIEIPGMEVIDIHPTVARLLDIEPGSPLDGRAVIAPEYRPAPEREEHE